jgi:hypothetical protein
MKVEVALPAVVTVLYLVTAIAFLRKGNLPWALTWGAYSMANIGLIWASLTEA